MRTGRPAAALAVVAVAASLLAGCAAERPAPESSDAPRGGTLTILAAASLTDVVTELAGIFESEHPGVEVVASFGGSAALAQQILQGAPADLFAAASPETMQLAVDGGAVDGAPRVFASNTLQIVVPDGNPAAVSGLADLADPALAIALCAPEVPCGAVSAVALADAGVVAAPDTLEQDVRAVLTRVELGEADAGLVYRTDVLAAGEAVEGISFPEAAAAATDYPIAVLEGARDAGLARAFADLVLSERGREVLDAAGFARG